MNKSITKFITDFGPLLVFFVIYYNSGRNLIVAIPPFVVATVISLIIVYFIEKKIPLIPLTGGILITLFGGLTIYFNNPIFLYVKPTIINLLFAITLIFGRVFLKKSLLKNIFQGTLKLSEEGWGRLNSRWIGFFIFLAILNELVWRTQTEAVWVNFKVWGILTITFVFSAFQVPLINKYKIK